MIFSSLQSFKLVVPTRHNLRGHGLFVLVFGSWLVATLGVFLSDGLVGWSAGLLYVTYDTALLLFVAWKTRSLRNQPVSETCIPLAVTILVPARNEATVLAACLDAVLPQCGRDDQVWVIDDGSNDRTMELLRERYAVGQKTDLGLLRSEKFLALGLMQKSHSGKADSLNRAWPLAPTGVIITLDADTVLDQGAITAIRTAFAGEPQLAAACGILTPRCAALTKSWFYEGFQRFEYLRAFLARAAWERVDALLLVSGAFAAYRTEVLHAVGGYNALSLVEDYDLIHRIHRHAGDHRLDWRVRVIAAARASTDAPATLRSFLHQRERWFAGFLETQFRNQDMAGNPRYGAVGRIMLPVKAIDTLQPVFGITAFVLLVWFIYRWDHLTSAVILIVCAKLLIDFTYHLWALRHYHRWMGQSPGIRLWIGSIAASLAEPFCFQLMRHVGALRGWVSFLRGSLDWTPQRNTGVLS